MMSSLRLIMRALALMLVLMSTANAYVDPGTGAMIIQMIGAAIAGSIFYFRNLRRRVISWFTRNRHVTPRQSGPNNE